MQWLGQEDSPATGSAASTESSEGPVRRPDSSGRASPSARSSSPGGSSMKRRNVQMAFVGEGVSANDDVSIDQLVDGDEAVDIDVRGGKLMVVVPAGTPDDQIFEAARNL